MGSPPPQKMAPIFAGTRLQDGKDIFWFQEAEKGTLLRRRKEKDAKGGSVITQVMKNHPVDGGESRIIDLCPTREDSLIISIASITFFSHIP